MIRSVKPIDKKTESKYITRGMGHTLLWTKSNLTLIKKKNSFIDRLKYFHLYAPVYELTIMDSCR
jgi:hypothetical protein